jgi:hypothetical protein
MRVLCLGILSGKEISKYAMPSKDAPTIYDYDLVIIDSDIIDISTFHIKKDQFERFFMNGGICFVLLSKSKSIYTGITSIDKYDFLSIRENIKIRNVSGEWISCELKEAQWLFDNFSFTWDCSVYDLPVDYNVIAVNKVNDVVSFSTQIHNGYCIFIPKVDNSQRSSLVDTLIQRGQNLVQIERGIVKIPEWLNFYATELERNLLIQKNEIEKKLGKAGKIKPLLYETGNNLERIVLEVFKDIGFEIMRLSKECYADFEFSLSQDLTAVCEIKGLLGSANVQDLRQLLQYFIEQRDIEQRNVKGIFIVNHFRETKPDKRGAPLTKDALELINKHNFKVVTTVEIYNFLTENLDEKVSKHEFIKELF